MKRLAFVLAAALAVFGPAAAAPPPSTDCAPSAADAAWIGQALAAWELTRARHLKIAPDRVQPLRVFFDERCRHETRDGRTWRNSPHDGQIALPDGGQAPARVTSFAGAYDHDRRAFFVMALPGVWRAGGVKSELGLETLMTGVFIHEFAHTRQFSAFNPRMAELTARWGLPADINDDAVQGRFGKDEAYRAAFEAERDLLFRAAAAPTDAEARALARQALQLMTERRARWFMGDDARYADLDDLFLTLEGIGQWSGYAWLTDPQGGAIPAEKALPAFRRGDRQWSQAEGLALFLVIDRLLPGWQARAFAPKPAQALELLSRAAA